REEAEVIARFDREEEIRAQLEEIARLQSIAEEREEALLAEEASNRKIMDDNECEAHTPN
ncbi:hypothetical protein KI387_017687, partial [Taxus chinensis]